MSIELPFEAGEQLLSLERSRVAQEFEGLEAFAAHMIALTVAMKLANRQALKDAAALIKKDASAQIGHYQDAVGAYPEWAPLAESTEEQKARLGAPADAPLERFGDLKKSFASTLEGEDSVIVGSTDPVMDYHEFGTSKMPPRPVIGPALYKNLEKIERIFAGRAVQALIAGQRLGYRFDAEEGGIGGAPTP